MGGVKSTSLLTHHVLQKREQMHVEEMLCGVVCGVQK